MLCVGKYIALLVVVDAVFIRANDSEFIGVGVVKIYSVSKQFLRRAIRKKSKNIGLNND